ncbi:MAG: zinc finger Ran-binding domain-containing family 2 protein [Anaerolineales bacterium]|nr:zinc finger Ran-binding domain-containing family 2 protein [Anaerolineales bacterium]
MKGDFILKNDDWECSNCGARNVKSIEVCIACGHEKTSYSNSYSKTSLQAEGTKKKNMELLDGESEKHKSGLSVYYRLKLFPAYLLGVLLVFLFSKNFESNILLGYIIFPVMVVWIRVSGHFWLFFFTWTFSFFFINPDFFIGNRIVSLIAEALVLNIFVFWRERKSIFVKILFVVIITLGAIMNFHFSGYSLLYDLWQSRPLMIAILIIAFLGVQAKINSTLYNIFRFWCEDAH